MTYQQNIESNTITAKAASAVNFGRAAAVDPSGNSTFAVLPASGATAGVQAIIGLFMASQPTYNQNVGVQVGGIGKGFAAASLGAGCLLMENIAASPGLVPYAPSGVASALGVTQYPRYTVGVAVESASGGDIFAVLIRPQTVI